MICALMKIFSIRKCLVYHVWDDSRGFLKGKDFYNKKEMPTFHYYKSLNIFTNQGTHNLPSLAL